MRYTDIDQRIAALAAKQYGAFSRQQAFELGASERFVERRLTASAWARLLPGVYVLHNAPGTWLRQCKIAELSVPGSGLAVRSGAAIHDFTGFRPGPIELAIPSNASTRHTTATLHRFAGAALTEVKGIRVTTIAQTLFDLAGFVSPLKVERALDDCLLGKRLDMAELIERQIFYAGSRRPGLHAMQALIAERSDSAWEPPASELEALLHRLLARLPGSPRVIRQAALPWRSALSGRVDTFLPDFQLIVEADGRRWHARVADFDRDRWRDNEAVAHGLRVQRLTWVHLHDFPDDALDLLERTLITLAA